MGPIAIRARVVRLVRRAPGGALAVVLVLVLGAMLAVHHATMATHDVAAAGHASSSASPGPIASDAGHDLHGASPAGAEHAGQSAHDVSTAAGTPAPDGDGHAGPVAPAADDGGHAALAMAACLAVLGGVGAAVVALRAGVLRLGTSRVGRAREPAPPTARSCAPRARAGPAFVVLAVDRR